MISFNWGQFDPGSFWLGAVVGALFLVVCAVVLSQYSGRKQ